jgi:hypothetical protein
MWRRVACENRRFGGTCSLQEPTSFPVLTQSLFSRTVAQSDSQLLTIFLLANFSILKMEVTRSSETSVLTTSTQRQVHPKSRFSQHGATSHMTAFFYHYLHISLDTIEIMQLIYRCTTRLKPDVPAAWTVLVAGIEPSCCSLCRYAYREALVEGTLDVEELCN